MRSTARPVFETVATRLDVDPALLAFLFNECLQEIILESESKGSCTVRGVGKFRQATLEELIEEDKHTRSKICIFERTKHAQKKKPFATLRLSRRIKE